MINAYWLFSLNTALFFLVTYIVINYILRTAKSLGVKKFTMKKILSIPFKKQLKLFSVEVIGIVIILVYYMYVYLNITDIIFNYK